MSSQYSLSRCNEKRRENEGERVKERENGGKRRNRMRKEREMETKGGDGLKERGN